MQDLFRLVLQMLGHLWRQEPLDYFLIKFLVVNLF